MNELITIIIPVYNSERFILDTINTIMDQTYKNWEAIFVNDCSTDKSLEILKKYASDKIKIVDLKKNCGPAIARNIGIRKAKGRYIAFLDADDLWNKKKLEKQITFMNEKQCVFSFTSYEFANEYGVPNGKKVFVPARINYKQALKNTTIWTSTVMLDVTKIVKRKIYMPNIKSEDTACWWKILKTNEFAYGLNDVLSFYRRTNTSLTSNKLEAIKRTWNLYRKQEKLNLTKSIYNFSFYIVNAIKRRI